MRHINLPVLIFSAASQVGPLLCLATQPSTWLEKSPAFYDFLYQLILLLWPTWPIAVIEVNTGRVIAGLIAASANALLFALLGAIVGLLSHRRFATLAIFVSVCFVVAWYSGLTSGGLSGINGYSLALALFIYAALFLAVNRAVTQNCAAS